jgi:hypothetical protein
MSVRILDLTPGNRGIWFNKNDARADFGVSAEGCGYQLVVFDPPHANVGATSNMSRNYGHSTAAEIREFITEMARTAWLRSMPNALMAFKWNDHDRKLSPILDLMIPWWSPLFGQRTAVRRKHASSTYWVMLVRRDAPLFAEVAAE